MQIVIDIDERYFEIIKASVESGNDYKPFVLIANGTPLKTGRWIEHPKGICAHLACNKCYSRAPLDFPTNYCPICGAKMESEERA